MKKIEKLYKEYSQEVYGYILHLTHNPSLSEDLLQEVFLKAIVSIGSFKGKSTIKTWLFGIARNLWLQELRRHKKTIEYNDLLEIYVKDELEAAVINKELIKKIEVLLADKEERTRKIMKLRIQGKSYGEIALELQISESSARVIEFRTRKGIREVLVKEGYI